MGRKSIVYADKAPRKEGLSIGQAFIGSLPRSLLVVYAEAGRRKQHSAWLDEMSMSKSI